MTQSFLTRDLDDISENDIKMVYVKSIIENGISGIGNLKQRKKKETFLRTIISKIDVNSLTNIIKSRERKVM